MPNPDRVIVGKVTAVFGLKGWVKVFSYTEPRENILQYRQLFLHKGSDGKWINIVDGQLHGKNVLVQFEGITDRDQAQLLAGYDLAVGRKQLPATDENEYYWTDLIGLNVENREGVQFGKVESLFETGANDVLFVKGERERAIPFLQNRTVLLIDLENRKIIVDWDADF